MLPISPKELRSSIGHTIAADMRQLPFLTAMLALSGCATTHTVSAPVEVQILAINDFHGALEPPRSSIAATTADGERVQIPAGGAAHLATAVRELRKGHANTITVAAGDLTSASPFVSSQFLDEPAILALNEIGVELNSVGNHEFDRGPDELLRLQKGGCATHTKLAPCRVDRAFPGARFEYLAANVRTADGSTLFPGTSLKTFGVGRNSVKVGFIGLTLRETPTLVLPSAVASLSFADEATTINALIPRLKDEGADAVVVLIHQGARTKVGYNDKSCDGLSDNLLPILAKLDPAVDLVVSGHTHEPYVCDYGKVDATRPILFTSAGRNGMLVTDITLSIDPRTSRVVAKSADNVIVQGAGYSFASGAVVVNTSFPVFPADPTVNALVARYVAAAGPIAARVVGKMNGTALRARNPSGESSLGSLVADAQLDATEADIAFMNSYGLRADLQPAPDGTVTFKQIYDVQPFGNLLEVRAMSGAQIRAVLEQQFASGSNTVESPNMLQISRGLAYSYDLRKPEGQRIVALTLKGDAIRDEKVYNVAVSNFLANGGDNFTVFREGRQVAVSTEDLDALETYFRTLGTVVPPALGRITRLDAEPSKPAL